MKIIITGSEGLIGRNLCCHLEEKRHTLIKLDLQNGHDLTDESFVSEFFSKNINPPKRTNFSQPSTSIFNNETFRASTVSNS